MVWYTILIIIQSDVSLTYSQQIMCVGRMEFGCYEETAPVEFRLIGHGHRLEWDANSIYRFTVRTSHDWQIVICSLSAINNGRN